MLMALLLFLSVTPVSSYMDVRSNAATTDRIIYLNTGGSGLWEQSGAWFIAWVWGGGTTDAWYKGTKVSTNLYSFTIPAAATNVIFLRKNPANTGLDWNGEWNRMETTITSANNQYTISSWSSGSWGKLNRTVTFSLSGVTKSSGNASTLSGSQYTAKLAASTGYNLPSSITVKAGSTTLTSGTHYTYNSSTGDITIYGTSVTDSITITATGTAKTYTVSYELSGVTKSSGDTTATHGKAYSAKLAAEAGYNLPAGITVKVGGTTLTSGYTYTQSTGAISINAASVTGNIVITATGEPIPANECAVNLTGTGVSLDGASSVTEGEQYTATLIAATGYTLPSTITVKVGNTTLTNGYTYNSTTGALTIDASYVTDDITITANATANSYDVKYTLTDVTKSSGDVTAVYGSDFTAKFTAADGFELPSDVVVTIGSTTLKKGSGYNYSDGTLTITGSYITDDISITVAAIKKVYSVTFSGTNVTSNGAGSVAHGEVYTATLTPVSGYTLPQTITVKRGSTNLGTAYYSYDYTTGVVTLHAGTAINNITITAVGDKRYTVAGTASLTGVDWDPSSNPMTKNSNGKYTITFTDVAPGEHKFKVTNGTWNENYGGSGSNTDSDGNYVFSLSVKSNVTITFDPNTKAITVETEINATSYGVTFNGTNVSSNGADKCYNGADYSATLSVSGAGYRLPDEITVTCGNKVLISGTDYTYDKATGALVIKGAAITDAITIKAVAADNVYIVAGTAGLTGSEWDVSNTANQMTKNDDGTYTITFTSINAGTHEFKVVKDGNWDSGSWPDGNYSLTLNRCSDVTITFNPSTGAITHTTKDAPMTPEKYDRMDEITLNPDEVFYVDADIVDYLNDERVGSNAVHGYFTNNQGIWNNPSDSTFSYFNDLISQQVGHGHYTYPLYFGGLHYIEARYSRIVGDETRHSLSKWHSAPNTALTNGGNINADAVVQGLVGSTLADGNLTDPVTGDPLLYFNKTAADEWTNRAGDYPVMTYYADLQFPFKMVYDAENRVTKYSYDSAEDYAVYYDYTNKQLYASSKHVKDTPYDGVEGEDYGFYPLNEPDDTENQLNHGFGAKFSINFTVGEDGLLANGEPVTFDFTGDDDLWVFIDGTLILDMGGAHAMASGSIDFSTLTATVKDACTIDPAGTLASAKNSFNLGTYPGLDNSWLFNNNTEERANVTTGEITSTFKEMGIENFDYSAIHTMTVFYMERCGIESNFSMEFTMVPVPSGMTLSKELNDKDINAGLLETISGVSDFNFDFAATSPSITTSVAFQNFTLTDKHTGMVTVMNPRTTAHGQTFSTTIHGVTNYTYAHSFFTAAGEHAFIPGTSFNITETTNGIFKYAGTKWTVYDAKNGYAKITGDDSTDAEFTMGKPDDTSSYSYAVVFTNTMQLGSLQISKFFEDQVLSDSSFCIQVYLDLDGTGTAFEPALYSGLVYTINGTEYKSTDGSISLKGGQTAMISGIPAGATYQLVEVIKDGDPWVQTGASNPSGTINNGELAVASFTNTTIKHGLQGKMIFVEAGTATNYALTYDGQPVTITSLANASAGLTAVNNETSISITGAQPNMVYAVEFSGRLPNGEIVFGIINVYTFAATHKTYVFDFGLSSDLADMTHGAGLFQGGSFYNDGYDGTTATLFSLTGNGNIQTTVSAQINGTIGKDGSYSAVTFTPVGFMNQVETYTYTVRISVNGVAFDAANPETGAILTGSITVMPANTVYYEDNFNATGNNNPSNKIIFSGSKPATAPNLTQSNDQNGNYGYDDAYLGGYAQSSGSATTLTNGDYAYFTFSGTGFDLISRTNGTSAGFAIYVFAGEHTQEKLNFMNTFSGAIPADMVFVDTYYNNGDLHQVPVASVRLKEYGQYTVYVQALRTSSASLNDVTIDSIRIYNPLGNTNAYPLKTEQNTTIQELRELYHEDFNIVSLAGKGSNGVFMGMGNPNVVEDALAGASIIENMKGETIESAGDLESIYLYGPNNEMYLPKNFGIGFSYKVTSNDWTLQLGAKAVTASGTAKSITVYVKSSTSARYTAVKTITLSSATDLYYDLSAALEGYDKVGSTYDIIIISDSEFASNEFVSLTTVKHTGITLS